MSLRRFLVQHKLYELAAAAALRSGFYISVVDKPSRPDTRVLFVKQRFARLVQLLQFHGSIRNLGRVVR